MGVSRAWGLGTISALVAALVVLLGANAANGGNPASLPKKISYRVSADALEPEPTRRADARLWLRFTQLIPAAERRDVLRFTVFKGRVTDGFVGPLGRRSERWELGLRRTLVDDPLRDEVIVHEFGHLLTLTADQVPPHRRGRGRVRCRTFDTGEGCALPASYIALYVQEFWRETGTLAAWKRVERIQNQRRYDIASRRFLRQRRGQFVTRYAATNPGEDIAESWTSFVLKDVPLRGAIAAEKHRFFERFPELVELRTQIRASAEQPAP